MQSYLGYYRGTTIEDISQLYIITTHRAPDTRDLPPGETVGSNVYFRRRHNAIYCNLFWQEYPKNDTIPAAKEVSNVPLQGWMPPSTMPAHPVFAFYGRDLSDAKLPLPVLRPYGVGVEQKMFTRVEDRRAQGKRDDDREEEAAEMKPFVVQICRREDPHWRLPLRAYEILR